MLKIRQNLWFFAFIFSVAFVIPLYAAESSGQNVIIPKGLEGIWDPAKYISIDEIKPGMDAYCLTEYGTAGIEQFGLEVVDIVRDIDPGRDAVLVKGTDERFIQTGPVAGCSGSPVYIEGRLAGALAFTWPYAKEPLYGMTPIADMLRVGSGAKDEDFEYGNSTQSINDLTDRIAIDFTAPVDLVEVDRQLRNSLINPNVNRGLGGTNSLPCPLITSGLPSEVCDQLRTMVEPFGYVVVSSGGGSGSPARHDDDVKSRQDPEEFSGRDRDNEKIQLKPGACLAIPWVSGDITMATMGTVTEVVDNKVYGFGHLLLGYGKLDLPMATGKVHTIVSNIIRSFKLAEAVETVGALRLDEATGVIGLIGEEAKTIPLTIRVNRYNDTEERVYNCLLATNRLLTPRYLSVIIEGAALRLGSFPPEHMIKYNVAIGVKDLGSVTFENVSSDVGLNEMVTEAVGSLALLMNNPYGRVDIESIEFGIDIMPRSITSHIWSAQLSDSSVKAGDNIDVSVIVESFLSQKKKYQCSIEIPKDLAPGEYELTVCGWHDYNQFLVKTVPQRFVVQKLSDLVGTLNNVLRIDRDKLYFVLALPASGVTVEKAELPDLPATRTLVLQDAKRALKILPYKHWIEKEIKTGTVVVDKAVMRITVEQ
jgi:hypothetical protein